MGIKAKNRLGIFLKFLIGVLYVLPCLLGIMFSFRPNTDFAKMPLEIFSSNLTLDNYKYVFEEIKILMYFKNTFIMILIVIPCQIVLQSIASYAFACFEFRFKNLLFTLFLMTMMIPGEVTLISNYMTVQSFGLVNTFIGMAITSLVGVTGIFMLRQNMMSLPKELWEASRMDGCGPMRYFSKVVFPLCKSIIAAMSITSFVGTYNAYLWPLMVTTRDEMHTIQLGMAELMSETGTRYGYVLAGAVICMLIPVIVYIIGQEQIVEGMTAGAVKS